MSEPLNDGATTWPASAIGSASRVEEDFDEAWRLFAEAVASTNDPRDHMDAVATIFLGICQARVSESLDRIASALEDDDED